MSTIDVPSRRAGDEYDAFCAGVRRLCGIDLSQYKRGQMERRIRTFAGARGLDRLRDYLPLLSRDAGELEAFLDRVTINVSQLWRNPEQWETLARNVLPELAGRPCIRVWSAGCSYGAEAYTLAATCAATLPRKKVEIVGTDIDRRMVARARSGEFSRDDARDVPAPSRTRWFAERDDGTLQASRQLRAMCRFEAADLLTMPVPASTYDLVLCRNTVIYFTPEVKDALHARLAQSITPGGYLMIGSTERVASAGNHGLEPVHPFIYRKA